MVYITMWLLQGPCPALFLQKLPCKLEMGMSLEYVACLGPWPTIAYEINHNNKAFIWLWVLEGFNWWKYRKSTSIWHFEQCDQ